MGALPGYVRVQAALAAERERQAEKVARVHRAEQSCFECRYNVCYVRYRNFRKMGRLLPHEQVREMGQLHVLDTYDEVAEFVQLHPTIFISHQWLGYRAPDPDGVHFPAICAAVEKVCADFALNLDDTYVWVDYCSIPQRNASLQIASISSLPVYASMSRYFVIIAPCTLHYDSHAVCNAETYQRRGWCRLEQV